MKKSIYLILILFCVLIIACNNPRTMVNNNPYAGAWELVYTKSVTADTTIERTQFDNRSVKLLTQLHYAFGRQDGENMIRGGGGEYLYHDSVFTTYPAYHSTSSAVGATLRWKSTIKGDLWTIQMDTLNTKFTETWKRIVE